MNNRTLIFLGVAIVVVIGISASILLRERDSASPSAERKEGKALSIPTAAHHERKAVRLDGGKKEIRLSSRRAVTNRFFAAEQELSEEDQKTVDEIQKALDDENFTLVVKRAEKVMTHPCPAVRLKAVEALQWFGHKSIASLTPYLCDSDEEVKSLTEDAIEQALNSVENEQQKVEYIESIMSVDGACSEDMLVMLSGELNGITDDTLTVGAAMRVIEEGKSEQAVETMKEVYEFATGDEYTTSEAANKWLEAKRLEMQQEETP